MMRICSLVYVALLADLHRSLCAKAKLPSWRGPDAFFDGTLPSNRYSHGFASVDGWIYVFGGSGSAGERKRVDDGEAKIPYRDYMPLRRHMGAARPYNFLKP
jgi:hypothetical protein